MTIRQLKQTAEQFRAAYWPHRSFPVNIELIIERDLKMDIIPINGMQRDFGIDAYLVGDFSGIVVDGATYEEERFANRLRFSFAHEIGHFLLHRSLYARESGKFSQIADYLAFVQSFDPAAWSQFEWQANALAGAVLMPRNDFGLRVQDAFEKARQGGYEGEDTSDESFRSSAQPWIGRHFGVSDDAVRQRFITWDKGL